jgi:hypothetical protein
MRIYLDLTSEQKLELETVLKKSPKPYLRERASAILQIAKGAFGKDVAFEGLLQKRRKNTIYDWVVRYKSEGLKGLEMLPGRGRKASFSPTKRIGGKNSSGIDLGSKP